MMFILIRWLQFYTYLTILFGCHSNNVKLSMAIPFPRAKMMSLDSVVGAWNDAREATIASLVILRKTGVCRALRTDGNPERKL